MSIPTDTKQQGALEAYLTRGDRIRSQSSEQTLRTCQYNKQNILDGHPRVCRGGKWVDFSSNSIHIVSYLHSKGHPLSALVSVGDPHRAPIWRTVTPVIVASSPRRCCRGWRLHLERRISRGRSQRAAMRKSSALTLWLQVRCSHIDAGKTRAT